VVRTDEETGQEQGKRGIAGGSTGRRHVPRLPRPIPCVNVRAGPFPAQTPLVSVPRASWPAARHPLHVVDPFHRKGWFMEDGTT